MPVWRMSPRPESDTQEEYDVRKKAFVGDRVVGVCYSLAMFNTELATLQLLESSTVDQLHHDRRRSGFYFFRRPGITCKSYSSIENIHTFPDQ